MCFQTINVEDKKELSKICNVYYRMSREARRLRVGFTELLRRGVLGGEAKDIPPSALLSGFTPASKSRTCRAHVQE